MPTNTIEALIIELAEQVLSVDTQPYEQSSTRIDPLLAEVLELGDRAAALLAKIADAGPLGLDDELGSGSQSEDGANLASDLAFVAGLDLRHRAAALRGCKGLTERWAVIARVDGLVRHILRALVEVESALSPSAAASGLTHVRARELELALASRHAYYRFFRAIVELESQLAAQTHSLGQVLRLCVANVAVVVGRDIYRHLRVEDRHQLIALRERIFRWAADHPDDELGARRLWIDVSSCVTLLRGIHRRPILVEHDLELFAELLRTQDLRQLSPQRRQLLVEAAERDDELHAALTGEAPSFAAIAARLRRVHDQLATSVGRPAFVDELAPKPVVPGRSGLPRGP